MLLTYYEDLDRLERGRRNTPAKDSPKVGARPVEGADEISEEVQRKQIGHQLRAALERAQNQWNDHRAAEDLREMEEEQQ